MSRIYAVFYAHVFSGRDWERFGCRTFAEKGYKVIAAEFFDLIHPGERQSDTYRHLSPFAKSVRIGDGAAVDRLVNELDDDAIVLNLLPIGPRTRPVFNALAQRRINYGVASLGKIPQDCRAYWRYSLGLRDYVKQMASEQRRSWGERLRNLGRRKARSGSGAGAGWWLDAGTFKDPFQPTPTEQSGAKRLSVHSFDAETADNANADAFDGDYAVFLDDGFLGHPDFSFLGIPQTWSEEEYAGALKRLFDHVEREMGLEVKIALHPKSNEQAFADNLPGRKLYRKRTADLVKGARLAITQCSTSISFAVLFNKPVLFVTTDELESHDLFGPLAARLSSWLGYRRFNIDRSDRLNRLTLPTPDPAAYAAYTRAFLKAPDAADGSIWETLEREMMESAPV